MAIYFYKEFGPLGYLASYSLHGFYSNGIYYQTVEHFYQSQKFDNKKVREAIINSSTPKIASLIGRDRKNTPRKKWKNIKPLIMYEAVLLKFKTHKDLMEKLLATGDEEIIEQTVKENYWGCGPNFDGKNVYGKILVEIRDYLRLNGGNTMLISKAGFKKLEEEVKGIDEKISETQKLMGESVKRDNDLRENPEFMELRVKAMYTLPQRKKQLLELLSEVTIIEDTDEYKKADDSTVYIGSTVLLEIDGELETYTILGSNEADITEGIISYEAPFAKSIIGAKKGQTVLFNNMEIKVINISKHC